MLFDRVLDTTSTTGTGPYTLANVAIPTYRRPSDVVADSEFLFLTIEQYSDDPLDPPADEWVSGVFQYSATGPTITAVRIDAGSNGTSAVNFSAGVKRVAGYATRDLFGPTVSAGKDADARPTYPRTNDLYIVTDTGVVQRYDGSSWATMATSNTGTVTSVGLTMPNLFAVDKSPVTSSGTIAVTLSSQTKATFLAAPTASDGAPTFRVIAAGDLPSELNVTNLNPAAAIGGSAVISIGKDILYLRADEGVEVEGFLGASSLGGDGSKITNINADKISSGTLDSTQLPTTGVTDATYGSATASFVGAVDKYGRITSAANKTITPSWSNLVSVPANVDAFADLVSVADSLPYFTDSGKMALATFTSFARNLLDDADAATARGTLGATTVGGNTFTQTNPSAVGFNRVNADNTLTHRTPPQVVADINVVVTESGGTGTISDSTHRGRTVLFTDDTPEWEAPTGLTEGFICSLFPPIGKTLELTAGAGATVQAAGTTVGQNGAVLFWVSANTYRLSGDVS